MIRNKDIVMVGLQPWDSEIAGNSRNIAMEFARHNRVLYVNHPLDRSSKVKSKNNPQYKKHFDIIENRKDNIVKVAENIHLLYPTAILESANWIPSTKIFRAVNKINNKRFAKDILKGINKLGFKNYILFNDSDMFRSYHLKELLKPQLSIYYTRDNLMGVPYWFKHGRLLEPELFAKSDLVVANSTYLADAAFKYNRHSYYVGQGCDVEDFDNSKISSIPSDIKGISSPVIGYIGALYQLRLDIGLLEKMAAQKKEWNFVFIGPEDEAFKSSSLHVLPNVHFLGTKEVKELPAYLSAFNVAINPQKVNEVTIGNYPRKIDEYLAMGKAVVATETAAMSIFKGYVYFAANPEEYIQQIERALAEDNSMKQNERTAYARSHTWENSVAEMYKAMLSVNPLQSDVKEFVVKTS